MINDITDPNGRYDHDHRWHFLHTKTVFLQEPDSPLFKQVDYAYYVCNDCPMTNHEPNTIKRVVK